MTQPTNTAATARAVVETASELGADRAPLLEILGFDEATLADPDAEVPVERMRELWQAAYRATREPAFALRVPEHAPFGCYRVLDFLIANATSIGDGMTRIARYLPLINRWLLLDVEDRADGNALVARATFGPLPKPAAEFMAAMALQRSSDVWAREFTPLRVGFAHEAPPDVSVYEAFFGCPVRFDAGVNELVFSPAVWDEPIEVGNPDLSAVLERYAEDILARLPRGGELLPRVRSALSDELRGGDPTQTNVAKKLGLSPRTLQRRLKDEGTTFAQLLDDVRTEAAKVLLADANLSVGDVGLLLGFFDHGSFTRAFRGWTGQTPSAWRLSQAL